MSNLRILITGATGFLGSNLVRKLESYNYDVMLLSRRGHFNPGTFKCVQADLADPESYRHEIEKFKPQVVIHLAWSGLPDYSYRYSIENLTHSLELFSIVINVGSCKKILVSGSCWEYSDLNGLCSEPDKAYPTNNFTWAKHSLYSWLKLNCEINNIGLGWFRVFYVYGPGQRNQSLIPSIIRSISKGEAPSLRSPSAANDFVFIEDVVDAFLMAIVKNFDSGIFNIGSGESSRVVDVCAITESVIFSSISLTNQIKLEGLTEKPVNFWADIKKSKQQLDWCPKISLLEGIARTIQSYYDHDEISSIDS